MEKAQSGTKGKLMISQSRGSEWETRAGEEGGRDRDGSKRLDPQSQPWPSKGAVGRGEPWEPCASQGAPLANSERVSLLTHLVGVRPLENAKGERGRADSWPPERPSPHRARGAPEQLGFEGTGKAWVRGGTDSGAGHTLLGRVRVRAGFHAESAS